MKKDDDDTNLKDEGGSSKDNENEPKPSTSTAGPSSPDSVQDSLIDFEVNKTALCKCERDF